MNKSIYTLLIIGISFNACKNIDKQNNSLNAKFVTPSESNSTFDKERSLEISYLGNMGVLIESGEKTVLFDGLHEKYKPAYQYPSEKTVTELIRGEYKGFSEIEVNLVTHNHKDHFSAKLNKLFLKENKKSVLIGTNQIISPLIDNIAEKDSLLLKQLHELKYDSVIQEKIHNGIKIKSIRCDHSNALRHKAIENMLFIVTLDNYSILHVGDTYWNFGLDVFEKINLKGYNIDIAILPYWMLNESNSEQMVERLINPQKIIATHLPPDFNNDNKTTLSKKYSNISLFTKLNERLFYIKKPAINKG